MSTPRITSAAEYRRLLTNRKPTGKRIYALGRLKAGTMNKTERAYSDHLAARQAVGEVAWFKFEGVKLRLAELLFLTVDFAVMLADGSLQMHEVKGAKVVFMEDARAKIRMAAEIYPFVFVVAYPLNRKFEGWEFEWF